MFVPPPAKKERFNDLYTRVTLKRNIPSLPPELCTNKTYNRWFAYEMGGLVILLLALIALRYWLRG
jgi:hypothetical protein